MKPGPVAASEPVFAPETAYLRLCRVDESTDADRRSRRYKGMVRAGY